jgi:hypothetical protein
MDERFQRDHPRILGALLDAVVVGLKNLPTVKLRFLPRMADFATWVTACEPGLGLQPGEFLAAYAENRSEALASSLEANVIAPPLMALVRRSRRWHGTATELLRELGNLASSEIRRQSGWPRTAAILSGTLKRLAPPLRQAGVSVDFGRSHHPRTITLEWVPQTPSPPSPLPAAPTQTPPGSAGDEGEPTDPDGPSATCSETGGTAQSAHPVAGDRAPAPNSASGDAGDDGDNDPPTHSDCPPRATDDSSPSPQPPMSVKEMMAESQAAQQAAPPPADADMEPDSTEQPPNSCPPDAGPPGDQLENQDGPN